jgi:hypothetical protein
VNVAGEPRRTLLACRSPPLSIVPVVDLPADLILLVAVPLLDLAFELIAATVDHIEIVVGKLAPIAL